MYYMGKVRLIMNDHKGGREVKRRVLDRPGKKHLVIFKDREDKIVDHMWLTTEEQLKMQLHKIRSGRLE